MSTTKKPGTDLAALKARLAQKSQQADPNAHPGAGAPYGGPMGEALPPPGSSPRPANPAAHGGGQQMMPPPGQQPAPAYAPHAPMATHRAPQAPDPAYGTDNPLAGGGGYFDPSAGVLDGGGEVKSRSNIGLILFVLLFGAGLGIAGGYLGYRIVAGKARVAEAQAKGLEMLAEVKQLEEIRARIALAMEGLEKKAAGDPKAAAADISKILSENFETHPKVDALFGWQLGAIHSTGIKRVFELYDEANRLRLDLGVLAAFLDANADALATAGGPTQFAVVMKTTGVQIVEATAPMCGEGEPATLKPCTGDASEATGYQIRDGIGAEPKIVPRGAAPGQATLLLPEGPIYTYAIGMEPAKNALVIKLGMFGRVRERLDSMAKTQKTAVRALEKYSDDPDVDGSSPQSDPEGE